MPQTRRAFLSQLPALLPLAQPRHAIHDSSLLGVAVCGLDRYTQDWILPALLHHSTRCRLAGLIDANLQQARLMGRSLGIPEERVIGFNDMQRLASQAAIDAVYVASPTTLHPKHTIAALAAGKHVICRKPMAPSSGACQAMIQAARRKGLALAVDYQLHCEPHVQALQRLVAQQGMGPTTHVQTLVGIRRDDPNDPDVRLDTAGPYPLVNLAILGIQAACYGTGQAPRSVSSAQLSTMRPQVFGRLPDTMLWTLRFADGASASGEATFNRTQNHLRVEMQRGWVEMEPAFTMRGIAGRTSTGPLAGRSTVNLMAVFLDEVAQAITTGARLRTPGEMGLRDLLIIEGIFRAAVSRRAVAIGAMQQEAPSKTRRPGQ